MWACFQAARTSPLEMDFLKLMPLLTRNQYRSRLQYRLKALPATRNLGPGDIYTNMSKKLALSYGAFNCLLTPSPFHSPCSHLLVILHFSKLANTRTKIFLFCYKLGLGLGLQFRVRFRVT